MYNDVNKKCFIHLKIYSMPHLHLQSVLNSRNFIIAGNNIQNIVMVAPQNYILGTFLFCAKINTYLKPVLMLFIFFIRKKL